jgi:6-phosphogluconate dehydrogenase
MFFHIADHDRSAGSTKQKSEHHGKEVKNVQIAMIGLGRMGLNMVRRLLQGGHDVVAYNRTPQKTEEIAGEGATAAYSLAELAERLSKPRVVWMMLPAGPAVDDHLLQLKEILGSGDIVIDGGNTYYKDDIRRAAVLEDKGIRFMDAGVSGGIWGLKVGYCLMVGGPKETFEHLKPLFETLAPEDGYLYCGLTGAGHFVKMVHNGIEYGMMQAYGEGFQILDASSYGGSLNYAEVAHLWNKGSVVRSWLLELAEAAFAKDGKLTDIRGVVEDSGEGRWTVNQAVETGVSAPVITLSLMNRFRSRETDTFSDRVVAALRREFGGHAVVTAERK